MKICLLAHSSKINSSLFTIFLRNAEEFVNQGNQVTILLPYTKRFTWGNQNKKIVIHISQYDKYLAKLSGGFNILEVFSKLVHILQNNYDLIYVYRGHRPTSLIPSFFVKVARKKTIVIEEWWEWYSGKGINRRRKGLKKLPIKIYDNLFELISKRAYDGIVCISQSLANRIPHIKHKIVLPGAIKNINFPSQSIKRSSLGLSEEDFIIGLSNLSIEDTQDNLPLYHALSYLVKDYQIKIIVTGDKNAIKILSQYIGDESVINLGWVSFDEYINSFRNVDVSILPYPDDERNRGRWPNKIGDYILIKKPIVTNPTGDVKKLFNQYHLGYMIENQESEYIRLLTELINNRLTQNDDFDFDKVIQKLSFSNRIGAILKFADTIYQKKYA